MTKQSGQSDSSDPKTNRLLNRLETADYDALMRAAKVVPLKFRKIVHRQDDRVEAVYFPLTCMVSMLSALMASLRWKWQPLGGKG